MYVRRLAQNGWGVTHANTHAYKALAEGWAS